jgi:hypothetical protein
MVHFTSAIAIIAGAVGLVAAQSYQDFTLDASVLPTFASRAIGLLTSAGGVATGKAACDALDDCLGVICSECTTRQSLSLYFRRTFTHSDLLCIFPDTGEINCVPFAYKATGVLNPGSVGWDSIHYR